MNNEATPNKVALQRAWNDQRMAGSIDWQRYRSYHMMFVQEKSVLVLWTYTDGGPELQKVLEVVEVGLSFRNGVKVGLVDQQGHHFTVDANPRQVVPGAFLWTPAFCEVRFVPRQYDAPEGPRQLSLALCAKMPSRRGQYVPGHSYIATMEEFAKDWPHVLA